MKSKLELIAEEQFKQQIIKNVYRADGTNQYSSRHPNALASVHGSDDPQNIKGKGTETGNPYEDAGGSIDVYGNGLDSGSGRIGNLVKNAYTKENPYPYNSIE